MGLCFAWPQAGFKLGQGSQHLCREAPSGEKRNSAMAKGVHSLLTPLSLKNVIKLRSKKYGEAIVVC